MTDKEQVKVLTIKDDEGILLFEMSFVGETAGMILDYPMNMERVKAIMIEKFVDKKEKK